MHERVLDVDQHADRRVDARERLDGEHRVEEARAAAAVGVRDLDAHHAEVEELGEQALVDLGVLVHVADERADLAVGELVHAVAEELFVFGERRSAPGGRLGVLGGHVKSPSRQGGAAVDLITAEPDVWKRPESV